MFVAITGQFTLEVFREDGITYEKYPNIVIAREKMNERIQEDDVQFVNLNNYGGITVDYR